MMIDNDNDTGYPDMSVSDITKFKKWKAKKQKKLQLEGRLKKIEQELADVTRERDTLRKRVETTTSPTTNPDMQPDWCPWCEEVQPVVSGLMCLDGGSCKCSKCGNLRHRCKDGVTRKGTLGPLLCTFCHPEKNAKQPEVHGAHFLKEAGPDHMHDRCDFDDRGMLCSMPNCNVCGRMKRNCVCIPMCPTKHRPSAMVICRVCQATTSGRCTCKKKRNPYSPFSFGN